MVWYKGNIHTHTTESDGDEEPIKVTKWYKDHGYDFLVLTDHNHRTMLDYQEDNSTLDIPLMIPGEEVTLNVGDIPVHINGIGIERVVEPIDAKDVVSTIQANVDAIRQAGGIASINHPNYKWAINHNHMIQVNGATLIEVFNGHAGTNSYGSKTKPSTEEIWDKILSSGKMIFGAATDDSHHYHDFDRRKANPGRGWICVQAKSLTQDDIMNSLKEGDFYSSTGVELDNLKITESSIEINVREEGHCEFTTVFTGTNGRKLFDTDSFSPRYKIPNTEQYVRATIYSSSGAKAWIQPKFIG
ncbi:MAG: CehA/McbA family metallohydrolase [SAR202 cluster bacterium]|nr:CehA/McbA family metallohydrolase [SAR202 cluster bacterium]